MGIPNWVVLLTGLTPALAGVHSDLVPDVPLPYDTLFTSVSRLLPCFENQIKLSHEMVQAAQYNWTRTMLGTAWLAAYVKSGLEVRIDRKFSS